MEGKNRKISMDGMGGGVNQDIQATPRTKEGRNATKDDKGVEPPTDDPKAWPEQGEGMDLDG